MHGSLSVSLHWGVAAARMQIIGCVSLVFHAARPEPNAFPSVRPGLAQGTRFIHLRNSEGTGLKASHYLDCPLPSPARGRLLKTFTKVYLYVGALFTPFALGFHWGSFHDGIRQVLPLIYETVDSNPLDILIDNHITGTRCPLLAEIVTLLTPGRKCLTATYYLRPSSPRS